MAKFVSSFNEGTKERKWMDEILDRNIFELIEVVVSATDRTEPSLLAMAQAFLQYRLQQRLVHWTAGLVFATWALVIGTIVLGLSGACR